MKEKLGYYTRKDLAKAFQVCKATIRNWEKKGLESIKIGKRKFYKKEDVDNFFNNQKFLT